MEQAFPRPTLRNVIQFPFELAGVAGKYSVRATVYGGGPAGQAGALRHASKAHIIESAAFRGPIKKEGLLTRDSRVKERSRTRVPESASNTRSGNDRLERQGSKGNPQPSFYYAPNNGGRNNV